MAGFGTSVAGAPGSTGATRPAVPPSRRPVPVNLDKGHVSLAERQTVSLVETDAPALRRVAMGLGRDPARQGSDIDLDASVIVVDADGRKVDAVWFMAKSACGGAIEHSGDNLTGQGAGPAP